MKELIGVRSEEKGRKAAIPTGVRLEGCPERSGEVLWVCTYGSLSPSMGDSHRAAGSEREEKGGKKGWKERGRQEGRKEGNGMKGGMK